MSFDFEAVDRSGTYTTKYDDAILKFGTDDLLPLWVADMDLASPPCVQEALQRRAAHPVYGYTTYPERYYEAIVKWYETQYGWKIEREWIVPCYGVVPSMNFAIEALSNKGEGIIVQTPIYPPFFSSVKHRKRKVLENPLLYVNGRYEIDFADFEAKAKEASLFLFCSPHNPTGRAWSDAELDQLIAICVRYGVKIVADEIHADIVYGRTHRSLGSFEAAKKQCVVLHAPSKTFNIAGLNTSFAVIPDGRIRRAYKAEQDRSGITNGNPFGIEALMAAYEDGSAWLEALKKHLQGNIAYVNTFLQKHALPVKSVPTEATFLMWLDCTHMGLSQEALVDFFIKNAKLGLNDGAGFGSGGEGFMRLNVGTSRSVIEEAMERLLHACKEIK
ncbi:MAG: PatB family C-S lyase [Sulfurovum sp.]|nr:PatB family C-S lyase [Sulfurovum sp.]